MKKFIILSAILLTGIISVQGQNSETKEVFKEHTIDIELAGSSFPYSIGYSYALGSDVRVRVGFGYLNLTDDDPESESSGSLINVPVTVDYLIGKQRHFLVLNAGLRFAKIEARFIGYELASLNKWMIQPNAGAGYLYEGDRMFINLKVSISYMKLGDIPPIVPIPGIQTGFRF